ncbi:MAG: glycerophosphodiester phosphodiesterase family protein [Pseudomonadota bacterium]
MRSPWLAVFALAAACAPAAEDSTADSAPPAGPPDPATWDCRAGAVPVRIDPVPVACMTDRACTELLVSGHRGMGGPLGRLAPENTLSAVRAAIAYGVDFVETDPRPTADGVLVNLHDTSVDRTTDGTGEAEALTLAEIQALHIEAEGFEGDFSCEYVPTLREVLQLARGGVHVLVDANKTDRVDLLVAAIQETDTLEWAIFDTSSVAKIDEALALEPALHTMIRVDDEQQLNEQLAHFADHPPVIVEIDEGSPELAPVVTAAGHRPFSDVFMTDIGAYNTDDPSVYAAPFAAGILIAQSDRPELVVEYLGR